MQGSLLHLAQYPKKTAAFSPGMMWTLTNALRALKVPAPFWRYASLNREQARVVVSSLLHQKCRVFSEHVRHFAAHSSAKSPAS